MAALRGYVPSPSQRRRLFKEVSEMLAWLSANLINIVLIALIALIVGLLIRGMIRERKAGRRACGGSCADCGACGAPSCRALAEDIVKGNATLQDCRILEK